MPRRRSRNLTLPVIILLIGLIYSQFESGTRTTQPGKPATLPTGTFSGKVVAVTDGDTIKVLHQYQEVKVRLHGVDSPEKNQDYGTKAKQFTSEMVFGETVSVEVRDHDRYGRVVGWVKTPDGKVLNLELVRAGYAWWYRDYARNDTQLERAETQAKSARRGLWADKNPVAPWDFRKKRK